MKNKNKVVVVVGPTSSGKSGLAVALATKIASESWRHKSGIRGAEIISADSRQIYRGLDITSGKITRKEMRAVPHHILGITSARKIFTAAQYQKMSDKIIRDILAKRKIPIICGGTGFYIDTLINNLQLPAVPPQRDLRDKLDRLSTYKLFEKLRRLDPRRAANIDRYNRRRLIRSLEIVLTTGRPLPDIQKITKYDVIKIGIDLSPIRLKKRINLRLDKRLRAGLVEEIIKLHKHGVSWERLDNLGLECRYASRYLRGLVSHEEMRLNMQKEIWHYARRQTTWFRKDKNIIWIDDPRKAYAKLRDFLFP